VVLLLSSTCLPALPSAACLPAADGWPANPPAFAEAQRRVYSSSSVVPLTLSFCSFRFHP
jgi:hypothetical protein